MKDLLRWTVVASLPLVALAGLILLLPTPAALAAPAAERQQLREAQLQRLHEARAVHRRQLRQTLRHRNVVASGTGLECQKTPIPGGNSDIPAHIAKSEPGSPLPGKLGADLNPAVGHLLGRTYGRHRLAHILAFHPQ